MLVLKAGMYWQKAHGLGHSHVVIKASRGPQKSLGRGHEVRKESIVKCMSYDCYRADPSHYFDQFCWSLKVERRNYKLLVPTRTQKKGEVYLV